MALTAKEKALERAEELRSNALARGRQLKAELEATTEKIGAYLKSEESAHDMDELATLGGAGVAAVLDRENIGGVEAGERDDGVTREIPGSLVVGLGGNIAARFLLGKVTESKGARAARKFATGMAAGGVYKLVGDEYSYMKAKNASA